MSACEYGLKGEGGVAGRTPQERNAAIMSRSSTMWLTHHISRPPLPTDTYDVATPNADPGCQQGTSGGH